VTTLKKSEFESSPTQYGCLYCHTLGSFKGEPHRMPKTCPTLTHDHITTDIELYHKEPLNTIMKVADKTPFTEEGVLRNRVEEIIYYSRLMKYQKIGIAFCVSLIKEAQHLAQLIIKAGLEAIPVCCRVGAVDYTKINLPKAHPDKFAAICNPVAQAELLNLANVNLVVQMGLCLGHDLILQEYCKAPITTLVVKDRVLDHHTVSVLR
jgi:uncharacterized metal-binding protein